MKVIASNKKGAGIHSPYIYRLVTTVLCDTFPYYAYEKSNGWALSPVETEQWKLFFRVVNFFQPDRIVVLGEAGNQQVAFLSEACRKAVVERPAEPDSGKLSFCNELVVWTPDVLFYPEIPDEAGPAVWLVSNLHQPGAAAFFDFFRKQQKVTVTLDLQVAGMIIFSDKLQKQDFVIKI